MAQVTRCTDPATGKVTYTNGECARGDVVKEIEARKTPEEIEQEREQAAKALQRESDRRLQEAVERREAGSAQPPRAPRRASAAPDPAQSAECQRARGNLQEVTASLGQGMYDEQTRLDAAQRAMNMACLSPADFARAESQRSAGYGPGYGYDYGYDYGLPWVVRPQRPVQQRPPQVQPAKPQPKPQPKRSPPNANCDNAPGGCPGSGRPGNTRSR
jgi:hypothetical protein